MVGAAGINQRSRPPYSKDGALTGTELLNPLILSILIFFLFQAVFFALFIQRYSCGFTVIMH